MRRPLRMRLLRAVFKSHSLRHPSALIADRGGSFSPKEARPVHRHLLSNRTMRCNLPARWYAMISTVASATEEKKKKKKKRKKERKKDEEISWPSAKYDWDSAAMRAASTAKNQRRKGMRLSACEPRALVNYTEIKSQLKSEFKRRQKQT